MQRPDTCVCGSRLRRLMSFVECDPGYAGTSVPGAAGSERPLPELVLCMMTSPLLPSLCATGGAPEAVWGRAGDPGALAALALRRHPGPHALRRVRPEGEGHR